MLQDLDAIAKLPFFWPACLNKMHMLLVCAHCMPGRLQYHAWSKVGGKSPHISIAISPNGMGASESQCAVYSDSLSDLLRVEEITMH
jgi:hypothetical protein